MNSNQIFDVINKYSHKENAYICSLGRTAELGFKYFASQTLFLDCLGSIVPTAVGVALGAPNINVIALDTDGSHLMGISILSTLSSIRSKLENLTIVVFDNEILESAGGLRSRYGNIDWQLLGKAWGMEISVIEDILILQNTLSQQGFKYIIAKVKNEDISTSNKDIDGIESKYIFSRHIEKVLNQKIIRPSIKN